MKNLFILLFFLLNLTNAFSESAVQLYFDLGLIDNYESKHKSAMNQLPVGLGISTDPVSLASFYFGMELNIIGGRIQYDPSDSNLQYADTKVLATEYRFIRGLRFKLFRYLLLGGGAVAGSLKYSVQGSSISKVKEESQVYGLFIDAGIGHLGKSFGVAAIGRYEFMNSDTFNILGGRRVRAGVKSARYKVFSRF